MLRGVKLDVTVARKYAALKFCGFEVVHLEAEGCSSAEDWPVLWAK